MKFGSGKWVLFFLLTSSFFIGSSRADVVKLTIHDTIHPITTEYIQRGIQYATLIKADAILIRIQTPGGLADATRDIIEAIVASPVPVIIYVGPSGARAASAGFFILESADIAAMAPGTNTGAAHPVLIGGMQPDKVMAEKIENDSAALMRSVVSKRGRNVEVAESAVRQSKSFTEQEALKDRLIEIVAANETELLRQLEGRSITRFHGGTATLHTANKTVLDFDQTLKQRILSMLMDPNLSFLLLAVGALGLYVEFNHPGAVLPGVVGVFFMLLALFALNILPVRYTGLALILLAFALFTLEAKFASHGLLAVGGIVSLTVGGLLLVDGPIPEMRVHWWTALSVSIPLGLITTFLMSIALKARRNKVTTGPEGLIGEVAVARTPLEPAGKVFVHGEIWNAVSAVPVQIGEQVRVQSVVDMKLNVEPVTVTSRESSRQSPVVTH